MCPQTSTIPCRSDQELGNAGCRWELCIGILASCYGIFVNLLGTLSGEDKDINSSNKNQCLCVLSSASWGVPWQGQVWPRWRSLLRMCRDCSVMGRLKYPEPWVVPISFSKPVSAFLPAKWGEDKCSINKNPLWECLYFDEKPLSFLLW